MNPKDQSNFDQAMALLSDNLPPMLWRFYSEMMKQGFTETQSFELVKTYVLATFTSPK